MRLIYLLLFFIPTLLCAQDGIYNLGARSTAMANASVTLPDQWALFNNPGALGSLESSSILASYQNRFNMEGFHVIGGGAVYHHKLFNFGVKYYKFGDQLFNQQLLGVVIANKFQMVSLGGGASIIQTHTEGVNTRRVWVGEFGGVAELTPVITFGAHIFNFKHGSLHPATMKAGLSFKPKDFLLLNMEIEKQIQNTERFKTAIEYTIIPAVFIRTGLGIQRSEFANTDVQPFFGFGLHPKDFILDYSFSSAQLGAIHEVSLSFLFKKS
ncbi:MAG: hypothetical protein RIC35_21245 [Marinoscillum sp.]